MKTKFVGLALFALSFTLILACITVNIYFPEATVKKAADEIVDEIRKKEAKETTDPEAIKEGAGMSRRAGFTLVPAVFAQEATNCVQPGYPGPEGHDEAEIPQSEAVAGCRQHRGKQQGLG